jgi:hypothetical protein
MSTERIHRAAVDQAQAWDLEILGRLLGVEAERTEQFPYGECQRFTLVDGAELELFASARIVRLRGTDFELTLTRVAPSVSEDEEGPFISLRSADPTHAHVLAFRSGSRFAFGPLAPGATAEIPDSEPDAAIDPADSGGTPDETTDQAEQERVNFTGSVVRAPSFHTTPKGLRLARFEVSEPTDEGEAVKHIVLAFNRQATQLEERPLVADQVVQVIGYPHQRRVTRDDQEVILTEIYAAAVRRKTT